MEIRPGSCLDLAPHGPRLSPCPQSASLSITIAKENIREQDQSLNSSK